jgi:hypothetical protein
MRVTIENPEGLSIGALHVEVDGALWTSGPIPFPPDGSVRVVRARIRLADDLRSHSAQSAD